VVEGPLEGCDSRLIMDRALAFVSEATRRGEPFLAVIWFHAPHEPVVGGPEYRALYADRGEEEQHYGAAVTALDAELGRLRAALRELGVADDTLLWFASDNGPEGNPGPRGRSRGSTGGLRGRKRSLYEGGVRVPGIVEWPAGLPAARVVSAPASTSDILPTVLAAAGLTPGAPVGPLDGVDVLPLLAGRRSTRDTAIGFHFGTQSAWTGERYKLVHNRLATRQRSDDGDVPVAEYELYDLREDPGETRDVAARHPELAARLRAELERWRAGLERP